jgi:RNA recognition motif-containing protein
LEYNWICEVTLPPTLLLGGGFLFTGNLPEREVKMDVRLYVGIMSESTTADELRTLFAQAGNVSGVDVIKDRDSNLSKGFCFVTMTDHTEAGKTIRMYTAYSMAEHELKVNVAKPRIER